jgi:hypothetical protein
MVLIKEKVPEKKQNKIFQMKENSRMKIQCMEHQLQHLGFQTWAPPVQTLYY